MGRSTVYNGDLVTQEKWEKVNPKNKELLADFIEYCHASDKSDATCYQYESQLKIVFVYILDNCENKFFVDLKKRELIKFALWCQNDLGVSNSRISSLKAVISSLSTYIERVLDEDYPTFRNISSVIVPGAKEPVRDKTVLTEEQINKLFKDLIDDKKYQLACYVAVLYASGMRKSEVIQMRVDDFVDENKVFDGKFYKTHKIRTKGRGKQGKILQKYVICEIVDPYLKLWLKYRKEHDIDSEWLFINSERTKEQATVSAANMWAEQIGKYLGVPSYNHMWRHAWCRMLKIKQYPDSVIQQIQGWASVDMVGVYSDISTEEELQNFFSSDKDDD